MIMFSSVLVLAACWTEDAKLTVAADDRQASAQEVCEAVGGEWGRFGLMQVDQCNKPSADANKVCRHHDECESTCVAENDIPASIETKDRCFHRSLVLGTCLNLVKDGIAQGVIRTD